MGQAEDLRAFIAIVEHESVGKAAELAGVAKSAMSRRLKLLEQRLQTELITRTTRQWQLTDAGRQYFQTAVDIVAAIDEADAGLRHDRQKLEGAIRLSLPLHFGTRVLSPLLLDFAQRNQDIHLSIDFDDRQVDLIGEHYDMAVRIGHLQDSSMIARKLCTSRHIFCASPAYLSAHSPITRPGDLRGHKILHVGHAQRFNWNFCGPRKSPQKRPGIRLKSALNSNNGEFLVAAAENGLGIIRVPDFLARPALDAGTLTEILATFAPTPLSIQIVYPASRFLPGQLRALIDFLSGELA